MHLRTDSGRADFVMEEGTTKDRTRETRTAGAQQFQDLNVLPRWEGWSSRLGFGDILRKVGKVPISLP